MEILLIIIGGLSLLAFLVYMYQLWFGKCPYCMSSDFVPDHGLYFYCNNCRRKF